MGGRFTVLQETGLEVTCPASDKVRSEPQEGARSFFFYIVLWTSLFLGDVKLHINTYVCLFIGNMG